jgi:hypothetical protein
LIARPALSKGSKVGSVVKGPGCGTIATLCNGSGWGTGGCGSAGDVDKPYIEEEGLREGALVRCDWRRSDAVRKSGLGKEDIILTIRASSRKGEVSVRSE